MIDPPAAPKVIERPLFNVNVEIFVNIPAFNVRALLVAPRLLSADMLSVPLLTNVLPVKVLMPPRINVPNPDAVKLPLVLPASIPLYVNVVPVFELMVPPPLLNEIPRFAFKVNVALVFNIPLLNTNDAGVAAPGAVPRLPSLLIDKIPAFKVVDPE